MVWTAEAEFRGTICANATSFQFQQKSMEVCSAGEDKRRLSLLGIWINSGLENSNKDCASDILKISLWGRRKICITSIEKVHKLRVKMMPCLSASRGYRPSPLNSPTSTTCSSSCAGVSDTKSISISSSGSEISSLFVPQKRPRTRRKRPQQMYNEAAAALSAIYPKIFSQRNSGPHRKKFDSKVWEKNEPLRFKEVGAPELLSQEVPTLIGRGREFEETELLCNEGIPPELKCGIGDQAVRRRVSSLVENDSDDSKFKSLSISEVDVDVSSSTSYDSAGSEYIYFLESSDGDVDGGIMSSIMGSDANPETEDGFGVFGFVQGTEYKLPSSAIRALRRTSDSRVCPVFDRSFPRLKLSDRSLREERNTAFSSSLDLLKRDDSQHRLKLQLNYEDVINAWSDRGSLNTDEVQDPQMVPDDSYSDPMVQFTHTSPPWLNLN